MAKYQQQAFQTGAESKTRSRHDARHGFQSSSSSVPAAPEARPYGVKRLWFCILGFNFGLGLLRRHIGRSSHVYTDTTRGAHVCTVCVCVRVHVCMCFCMWHIRVRTYVHIYIYIYIFLMCVSTHLAFHSFIQKILVDRYIQAFVRPSLFIRPPSQPTVHPSSTQPSICPSYHPSTDHRSINPSLHACMHTFTQHTTGCVYGGKN